jgi:hypothetical protein
LLLKSRTLKEIGFALRQGTKPNNYLDLPDVRRIFLKHPAPINTVDLVE